MRGKHDQEQQQIVDKEHASNKTYRKYEKLCNSWKTTYSIINKTVHLLKR